MIRSIALAVLLLVLGSSATFAASFDCKKAATAYETFICAHPDLGTLDETLAQAYATAIGGLSKPALETMRQGQRQWLDYVQHECTKTGELPDAYSEDDDNCIQSDLYNRIRALEGSRMMDGWRFYMAEAFSVTPTQSTEEYAKAATTSFSFPQIDSRDPVAVAFNAFIKQEAQRVQSDAAAGEASETAGSPASTDPDVDGAQDTTTTISVKSAMSVRISLEVDDSFYPHGAAHGGYNVTYLHYLTGEKRALTADDIFAGTKWQAHLASLALDALKAQLGENLFPEAKDGIADWVADPSRWNFTSDGLVLQFEPYEVASYADGAVTVTIPWGQLQDDLAADAMTIIG